MRIPVTDLLSIQGESREQDKEKRYGPVVVSLIQITEKIFTRLRPNRVCFCAWPHCPCRAARDTHRCRCPLPHGVGIVRVRVVVADANIRRWQRRLFASCELRVARKSQERWCRDRNRRACTNIKAVVYLIGVRTYSPLI
jgi:hypothetical protein